MAGIDKISQNTTKLEDPKINHENSTSLYMEDT